MENDIRQNSIRVCRKLTFVAVKRSRDVDSLASQHDNALPQQQLLGNCRRKAPEKMCASVDNDRLCSRVFQIFQNSRLIDPLLTFFWKPIAPLMVLWARKAVGVTRCNDRLRRGSQDTSCCPTAAVDVRRNQNESAKQWTPPHCASAAAPGARKLWQCIACQQN